MTAYPSSDPGSYEVMHLGGEAAAIVPLGDLRQLQAVQRHASPELLEGAEVEATLAAHREWVAEGRPGAASHEEVMAELLREQRGSSGLPRLGLRRDALWRIGTGCARSARR